MAIRGLRDKSARHTERKFVVEGHKCVVEALQSGWVIHGLFVSSQADCPKEWNAEPVSSKEMERMSSFKSPPGVLAVVGIPEAEPLSAEQWAAHPNEPFGMAVDGLSDPGNLGTLLRTADWFGLSGIWATSGVVDPFNPKVVQASMGAVFRVQVRVVDLPELLHEMEACNVRTFGMSMDGEDVWAMPGRPGEEGKWLAVLGSESHGLSETVSQACSGHVHIPGGGRSESLNATMAAGMVLSEWYARGRRAAD